MSTTACASFLWLVPQKPVPSNAVTPNYSEDNWGQACDFAILDFAKNDSLQLPFIR